MVKDGQITKEGIDLIRKTIAKDATDAELQMLLHLAQRYELDPFSREIMFIKRKVYNSYKQGYDEIPTFLVGRDGFLNIAHRSGQFGGIKTTPNFDERSNLVSATCKVWNKSCPEPIEVTVYLKEYMVIGKDGKGQALWGSKPITMLSKVAECQCLRKAFSISGVYDNAEIESELIKDAKTEIDYLKDGMAISEKLNQPQEAEKFYEETATKILDDLEKCQTDKDVWHIEQNYKQEIGLFNDEERAYIIDMINNRRNELITGNKQEDEILSESAEKAPVIAPNGEKEAVLSAPKSQDAILEEKNAFGQAFLKKAVTELAFCHTRAQVSVFKNKNAQSRLQLLAEQRDYFDEIIKQAFDKTK